MAAFGLLNKLLINQKEKDIPISERFNKIIGTEAPEGDEIRETTSPIDFIAASAGASLGRSLAPQAARLIADETGSLKLPKGGLLSSSSKATPAEIEHQNRNIVTDRLMKRAQEVAERTNTTPKPISIPEITEEARIRLEKNKLPDLDFSGKDDVEKYLNDMAVDMYSNSFPDNKRIQEAIKILGNRPNGRHLLEEWAGEDKQFTRLKALLKK